MRSSTGSDYADSQRPRTAATVVGNTRVRIIRRSALTWPFRRPGVVAYDSPDPTTPSIPSRAAGSAEGGPLNDPNGSGAPVVVACPHERIRPALRAHHEIQRLVAICARVFVQVRGSLPLLPQDLGDRVRSAGDIRVIALGVGDAIELDLNHPTRALSPESGRCSLHALAARFVEALEKRNLLAPLAGRSAVSNATCAPNERR